jgi:hypothetical protein
VKRKSRQSTTGPGKRQGDLKAARDHFTATVKAVRDLTATDLELTRRVQTGLRLDSAMFQQLRQSDRGVSDEIRDRLQRTFQEDSVDPVTRELRDGLVNVAKMLRLDFGEEWYSSPPAYEAFTAAVVQRLARYKPTQPSAPPSEAPDRIRPDYLQEPTIIGKLRETDDVLAHSYRHLAAVQAQQRAKVGGKKDEVDE